MAPTETRSVNPTIRTRLKTYQLPLMTAATASPAPAPTVSRVSPLRRIYGLGSVFGKTLRDSRRAMLITAGFFSMLWVITGAAVTATFGTLEARMELIALTKALPPILLGIYGGSQENVTTIGGFANWRYGFVMLVFPGIWSILALSGTLVGEARRGSLDLVAASPIPRWRVAAQKYLGHLVAVVIAMAVVSVVAWAVTGATATLTPEEIEQLGGTGTDANAIQLARGGVAAGLVSVPNRYMHSAVEMISLEDIDQAAELLAEFALGIQADADFTPR